MKYRLYGLALITLVGFPVLGWIILSFFRDSPLEIMTRTSLSPMVQVTSGMAAGSLIGWVGRWIISRPALKPVGYKYARIVQTFGISSIGVWLVSFCAGFGEELLFRGALQPLMGIWPTAFVFVAIHGYLDPRNLKITIYGVFMTVAIAGLGYMTEYIGIWSASVAHMMIDVILFYYLLNLRMDSEIP
jgi:hypothetical protein